MRTTTSRAFLHLVAALIVSSHVACHSESSGDHGDAGEPRTDANRPDTGGLGPPDVGAQRAGLIAEPSAVRLAPATVVCLELDLLYEDGTQVPVDASKDQVALSSNDQALAIASELGDCPGGGVIGLAPGSSTIRVSVITMSGVAAETLIPVVVEPLSVAVTLLSSMVLVDTEVPLPEPRVAFVDGDDQPRALPDASIVRRWLDLGVADPTIADVRLDPSTHQYVLLGKAPGTTDLTGRYGPPQDRRVLEPATITVPGQGTLVFLNGLTLVLDDGARQGLRGFWETGSQGLNSPDRPLSRGSCFQLLVDAFFTDHDGNTWSQSVLGATIDHSDSLTPDPSHSSRFCVAEDAGLEDPWLHACIDDACVRGYFAVRSGDSIDLQIITPSEAVAPSPGPSGYYCPALRVELIDASGDARDVSDRPSAYWWGGAGEHDLQRARDAWGAVHDLEGAPCFELEPSTSEAITVDFSVRYAGFTKQASLRLLAP